VTIEPHVSRFTDHALVPSGVNEPIAAQHPELDFGELSRAVEGCGLSRETCAKPHPLG